MTEPEAGGGRAPSEPLPEPPHGGQWSLGARVAIAVVVAAVCVAVAVHLVFVFLHVAPSNTLSKDNQETIDEYVLPEFEQNWKLFAPNPLQQNVEVHARAQVELPGGQSLTTGWVSLTDEDTAAIRHNPAPSHVHQNLVRRAYDFYNNTHDEQNRATGERGRISEEYIRRVVAHRLGPTLNGGRVVRVQVRSVATPVPPPKWSGEAVNTSPATRELPWWKVSPKDFS
ncbi:hypothetical protein GCM10027168_04230 [Streptomyces capparidis]